MSDWDRLNDQFREDDDERNERLAAARKKRAFLGTPLNLCQWADTIDNRLGPISGRDADALAGILRAASERQRAMAEALEQAQSCIRGETPEDRTPEQARDDTLRKIRKALGL